MMFPTDAAMTTRRSSLSGTLAALIGLPSCRAHCVHQAWMFVRFRPAARPGLNCGTTYRIFVLYGSIPRRPAAVAKDPVGRLTRRVTRPRPAGSPMSASLLAGDPGLDRGLGDRRRHRRHDAGVEHRRGDV